MGRPGHSVHAAGQLTSLHCQITLLRLNLKEPQIRTVFPEACAGGTMHDGGIAWCTFLPTLIHPSLWNKVRLDSYSYRFVRSHDLAPLLFMFFSKPKPFQISFTNKCSSNGYTVSFLLVLLSLLNIAVCSAGLFSVLQLCQVFEWSLIVGIQEFFPTTFLPQSWWFTTILPGFRNVLDSS